MAEFDVIYTYENYPQEFRTVETPETLEELGKNGVVSALLVHSPRQLHELVKISFAVMTDEDEYNADTLPKWIIECNGKLWPGDDF